MWTVAIGAVVAIVVSVFVYRAGVDALLQREQATLENSIGAALTRFVSRMEIARRDVVFLSRIQSSINLANTAGATAVEAPSALETRLAETFSALLLARPEYRRLRYVGVADGGRELVAMERSDAGDIERTPERALEAVDEQPYFRDTVTLPLGAVYVSPPRLDRGLGVITDPPRPVIHIATPMRNAADEVTGMIVIDANATYLFDLIRQVLSPGLNFIIAGEDGDYLTGPDPLRTYGFDLGHRYFVQDDIPAMAPLFDGARDRFAGFVERAGGTDLAVGRQFIYNPREPGHYLVLVGFVPAADILARIGPERGKVALVALALILALAVLAVVLARRVVEPLKRMTAAASLVARGEPGGDLARFTHRGDETGELARAFEAMVREIGEREHRLEVQAAELTRSNHDLAQFAYVASHDLQEPLRMVASYLDLLEKRYGDRLDDDAREFIGYAVDGAARMKRLINDLLDYSRAGNAPLKLETVKASEIVEGALHGLSVQIAETHAQVTVEALPTVSVDGLQLGRVFQNLVENAIKYRSRASPRVRIVAEPDGAFWRFSVRDNGIGVDPRFAGKVFDLFKRLHGREKYSGTGIGLAICKVVVARHGGRIWVEPRPYGGSVFSFTIPQ